MSHTTLMTATGIGAVVWWLIRCRRQIFNLSSTSTTSFSSSSRRTARAPSLSEFLAFETYVFDCDGVIWGIQPDETVLSVATINHLLRLGKRVMFVTNNSNKSRRAFVLQLESKGIVFGPAVSDEDKLGMMISSSYTTARYLKQRGLRRPFVITSGPGILDELRLAGIDGYYATVLDDGRPHPDFTGASSAREDIMTLARALPGVDCVVVGWDLSFTARKAALAVNLIQWHCDLHSDEDGYEAVPLLACAGDTGGVIGTTTSEAVARGTGSARLAVRAIGNGAMADTIARAFDPPLPWKSLGKPSENLIRILRDPQAYGVDTKIDKALMIGDTLQTDIVFGNRAGMATLIVMTGVTNEKALGEALAAGDALRHPTFALPSLGAFAKAGELMMLEEIK